jgi:hypothetical protein
VGDNRRGSVHTFFYHFVAFVYIIRNLVKCLGIVSCKKVCFLVTVYLMNDGLKGLVGVTVV